MRRRFGLEKAGPRNRSDQRAELLLGALACVVLALIAGMIIFVFQKAWPSFEHNGLAWFGSGGNVDTQLEHIFRSPEGDPVYTLHAWPLLWGTAVITITSVVIGVVFALLSAMFIVEFAPESIRRLLEPVVRLLAAVPSVIYGLIGILVIVPFFDKHIISEDTKQSVAGVLALNGESIAVGVLILTVMITPIMIAIVVDALRAVPTTWSEGALSLGINRWRALWTVTVRAARPAIVAAAVLATA
jgi:phosphate transport system permease protein